MPGVGVPSYAVGFIYIPGKLGWISLLLFSLVMCTDNRVHYGPMVVLVSLHITLSHYLNACQVHSAEFVSKIKFILSIIYLVIIVRIRGIYLLSSSNRKYKSFAIV